MFDKNIFKMIANKKGVREAASAAFFAGIPLQVTLLWLRKGDI